jgi:hypothetical protein
MKFRKSGESVFSALFTLFIVVFLLSVIVLPSCFAARHGDYTVAHDFLEAVNRQELSISVTSDVSEADSTKKADIVNFHFNDKIVYRRAFNRNFALQDSEAKVSPNNIFLQRLFKRAKDNNYRIKVVRDSSLADQSPLVIVLYDSDGVKVESFFITETDKYLYKGDLK